MEFSATEALFYAASFIASGAASFARILRDNEPVIARVVFGRCLSAGFTSFGVVAIWVGRDPSAGALGGFYWLAIAALIGYTSKDLHDKVLARVSDWILSKFGPEEKNKP